MKQPAIEPSFPGVVGRGQWLDYCCPWCKGALERSIGAGPDGYSCSACRASYPIVWGIPDFRVFPDPYISIEDDHRKAIRIAAHYDERDYRGLAEFYWSITPDTPPDLAQRYMRYDMAGEERGRQMLDTVARQSGRDFNRDDRILELGCRTGGFVVAAAERFGHVVGIDIAFRWLVVAKKRLEQQGHSGQLVCCCAQYLPFKAEQFDLVVAGNVIEHSTRQEQLFDESHRVLRPRGVFFAVTCNRLSLAGEPHVRVWGVGYLPRSWMKTYVRWRKGVEYEHVHLLSIFELMRMIRRSPFRRALIAPPAFGDREQEGLGEKEKRLIGIYNRVRNWPGVRQMLLLIGPLLELMSVRPNADGSVKLHDRP